ncbi:hypothetical protein HYS54_04075 [Candidatus Micrarchaeota archaeon]|nr:hypothetical protein [Candidatus Micrarchaeota archaeon]
MEPTVEFFVSDLRRSFEFYRKMGFETFQTTEATYGLVKFGQTVVGLYASGDKITQHSWFGRFPKGTPKCYGVELIVVVPDIKKQYGVILNSVGKSFVAQDLQMKRWGVRDFRMHDPDGYYIRFTEQFDFLK